MMRALFLVLVRINKLPGIWPDAAIAIKRTSVSGVWMTTFSVGRHMWFACRRIHVSACSWLHPRASTGAHKPLDYIQMHSSSKETYNFDSPIAEHWLFHLDTKNQINCDLFLLFDRKGPHCVILAEPLMTLNWIWPVEWFPLSEFLSEFSRYTSNTTFIHFDPHLLVTTSFSKSSANWLYVRAVHLTIQTSAIMSNIGTIGASTRSTLVTPFSSSCIIFALLLFCSSPLASASAQGIGPSGQKNISYRLIFRFRWINKIFPNMLLWALYWVTLLLVFTLTFFKDENVPKLSCLIGS